MKYGKYALIVCACMHISVNTMHQSAARRSGALLLNFGRNAQQKLSPTNFTKIGATTKIRADLSNIKKPNLPSDQYFSSSSFSFLNKKEPFFTPYQNWWQTPAKITAALAGGLGLTTLSTYLYRQWDLTNLQIFVNNLRTNLQSASLEQILKNIQTLQYYVKVDDPNTTPKAKELLHELRILYITKKYQEMPSDVFVAAINKSPGSTLLSVKDDILFAHENNNIIMPSSIAATLAALKNTSAADLLLSELEKNITVDFYTLNHTAGTYFLNKAEQNLTIWEAIKEILKPDPVAQPDQREQYAFDPDPNDLLLPF